MEKIKKQLLSLGISLNESEIYISILKLKMATIADISRETGIKRATIYYCLDALQSKGLVSRQLKDKDKLYYPENPTESLNNLIATKTITVESVLPQLRDLYGTQSRQPEIKIYRKIEGLHQMLLDSLNAKEKIARYYLYDYNIEKMLGQDFVDYFVEERIKRKINSKVLRPPEYQPTREKNRSQIAQLREIKYIPKNLIIKPYTAIYDNKVIVISTPDEKLGFVIESKEFATSQKNIFDYIWNTL